MIVILFPFLEEAVTAYIFSYAYSHMVLSLLYCPLLADIQRKLSG